MERSTGVTAHIDGHRSSREEVLAWEARRAERVGRKLDIASVPADPVAQREVLVERKLELGPAGLERLLARELRWSKRVGRAGARLSRGRRRLCTH